MKPSEAALVLLEDLNRMFPGQVIEEARFDPNRKWRFDFAVESVGLAVELEGAIWTSGRHVRGAGYQNDLDKYNRAAALGWTVFRFSTGDVTFGRHRELLQLWKKTRLVWETSI